MFITCWQLLSYFSGAFSLTRGRVWPLALSSLVFLGFESLGTPDHILLLALFSLYSLRTDHSQKTHFYCCLAPTAQKNSHMISTQRVHWHADFCLATSYKHSPYWDISSIVARFNVFTESLPNSALAIHITILFISLELAIHWLAVIVYILRSSVWFLCQKQTILTSSSCLSSLTRQILQQNLKIGVSGFIPRSSFTLTIWQRVICAFEKLLSWFTLLLLSVSEM
jgi:hypothetical protein